jgi:hypothetical protein
MGCDIHIVLERRKAGSQEWVGVWASDRLPGKSGRPHFAQRDYGLFSRFGVRGHRDDGKVIYPRNIPEDVSRLAWAEYMRAPTDYHSPSHLTPQEFADAWLAENPNNTEVRPEFVLWDLLNLDTDYEGDHRLVIWFDN